MKHPGALITFEGLDGCGKTTQLQLEAERLRGLGRTLVATKEPGGTALGRQVREIVLNSTAGPLSATTELALMFAARSQHIKEVIGPALQSGAIVFCDRFTDSTFAYQGYGHGAPLEDIEALKNALCRGVRPDLTLLLDIDPEAALERTLSRNRATRKTDARFEDEGLDFFRRVRHGYLEIARRERERVRIVDGRESIEQVHEHIRLLIDDFLKCRDRVLTPDS